MPQIDYQIMWHIIFKSYTQTNFEKVMLLNYFRLIVYLAVIKKLSSKTRGVN
jgi:hypothetical protein